MLKVIKTGGELASRAPVFTRPPAAVAVSSSFMASHADAARPLCRPPSVTLKCAKKKKQWNA